MYAFECSAGKVSRFTPAAGPEVVWHTNHPLANDDYHAAYRAARAEQKGTPKKEENSRARLRALEKRLGPGSAAPSLELIRETLASRDSAEYPVCRPYKNPRDNFTFATAIMVLSAKPALHVAPGPADLHPYQILAFSP